MWCCGHASIPKLYTYAKLYAQHVASKAYVLTYEYIRYTSRATCQNDRLRDDYSGHERGEQNPRGVIHGLRFPGLMRPSSIVRITRIHTTILLRLYMTLRSITKCPFGRNASWIRYCEYYEHNKGENAG